jgi:hypothetical protein
MTIACVNACGRIARIRGACNNCYKRLLAEGSPLLLPPKTPRQNGLNFHRVENLFRETRFMDGGHGRAGES